MKNKLINTERNDCGQELINYYIFYLIFFTNA